jgi:murein DD-endopeptidase MepM/ murein hydrolase activator NlpD
MYDATAKKLAVKVIGTVESNLNYGAINFNDPITVGVAQWYGVRAASILNRMRTENSSEWYGIEPSINSQLETISDADGWWNTRYLTRPEGDSLMGALARNQVLQNDQLTTDLDAYVTVFESYGFDADAHTDTLIYFMSMHHQGPAYALEVVTTLDTACTLEEMHAACLAHPVLGQYGSRYRATYDLINEFDFTGVDPVTPPEPEPTQANGNARLIQTAGDLLIVQFADSERITFYPNGHGQYTPRKAADDPAPPTPVDPPPPPGTGDWYHPAPGASITSPYGMREGGFHWGVDLSSTTGPTGVNILAVDDLVITVAWEDGTPGDPSNGTAGSYVKGHTTDEAYTFSYNHMVAGSIAVSVGSTVPAGTVLGVEGNTGNVTGTHLHLECYEGYIINPWAPPYGNPFDPLPVLRAHGVVI